MIQNEAPNQKNNTLPTPSPDDSEKDHLPFPVIGVGASAGGLHAFEQFFQNLPANPGMAFVLIQHIAPDHESELPQLLQNHTEMPVVQVKDNQALQVDRVYVIPPGQSLSIKNGVLHLSNPEEPRGHRAPIDLFFRSLAEDQKDNAVCVILSGTGNDGTLGLKKIKENGGVVLVQDPDDAEYDGMPRSAVRTNLVDLAAPIAILARKLLEYQQNSNSIQFPGTPILLEKKDEDMLQRIFRLLESRAGTDFSHYKQSTILRRLHRRMQMTQTANLSKYMTLLHSDPDEAPLLFQDFLISVTNFFRDNNAWLTLEENVIPELFENKDQDDRLRVWVPGCATGEEAFSLAMLLVEAAQRRVKSPVLQIFASDINKQAIQFARNGLYPQAIAADVSPERLERFFEMEGNNYRVRPELQEIILFTEHNLIKDAPFAHLDMVSCRNLLIYLKRDIQKHIFQLFSYALNGSGYLFLGSSESAEQLPQWFEPVHKRGRLYRAQAGKTQIPRLPVRIDSTSQMNLERGTEKKQSGDQSEPAALPLKEVHRQLMLERFGPPSVLAGPDYEIQYKFGNVGRFLQHQEGEPSLNLLDNVSRHMRAELRTGLFSVFRHTETVRPRQIELPGSDGESERVRLHIERVPPAPGRDDSLALVIFEPLPSQEPVQPGETDENESNSAIVAQLEDEIKVLRHRLQTTVEEYETSNEELKSSNEELQSMNEELRSTSEELETSREELRSVNEELTSVNQELKTKVEELKQSNSDLENLMEATDIATLFLDRSLRLKRYTPEATELFNIIPSDIDRPFSHISHKIDHGTLPDLAKNVLKSLETVEEEVFSKDGRGFLLVMRPYRTIDDKISGVVVTLVEITGQIEGKRQQRIHAERQQAVANLSQQALQGVAVHRLLALAVRQVAQALQVPLTHIFTTQRGTDHLLLAAGVGWPEEQIGSLTVPGGHESQAGYALAQRNEVVVIEREEEGRFYPAAALSERGVESGISVVIRGSDRDYGVLEAYSQEGRKFGEESLSFLRTIAHVLGMAISQQEASAELQALAAELELRVENRTQELERRGEQLNSMAAALTVAEQRERDRISRILHDDLQQLLHAAQIRVNILRKDFKDMEQENKDILKSLAEMEEMQDRALKIARSLTVELRPPVLEGEGLKEALTWLAGHMKNVYGLNIAVEIEDGVEPANEDLRELAFQITRELLFNVVKHADVEDAQLTMRHKNGRCHITVSDDGLGFDTASISKGESDQFGYGFHSIRERLQLFNGSLAIESAPDAGTQISFTLPARTANATGSLEEEN